MIGLILLAGLSWDPSAWQTPIPSLAEITVSTTATEAQIGLRFATPGLPNVRLRAVEPGLSELTLSPLQVAPGWRVAPAEGAIVTHIAARAVDRSVVITIRHAGPPPISQIEVDGDMRWLAGFRLVTQANAPLRSPKPHAASTAQSRTPQLEAYRQRVAAAFEKIDATPWEALDALIGLGQDTQIPPQSRVFAWLLEGRALRALQMPSLAVAPLAHVIRHGQAHSVREAWQLLVSLKLGATDASRRRLLGLVLAAGGQPHFFRADSPSPLQERLSLVVAQAQLDRVEQPDAILGWLKPLRTANRAGHHARFFLGIAAARRGHWAEAVGFFAQVIEQAQEPQLRAKAQLHRARARSHEAGDDGPYADVADAHHATVALERRWIHLAQLMRADDAQPKALEALLRDAPELELPKATPRDDCADRGTPECTGYELEVRQALQMGVIHLELCLARRAGQIATQVIEHLGDDPFAPLVRQLAAEEEETNGRLGDSSAKAIQARADQLRSQVDAARMGTWWAHARERALRLRAEASNERLRQLGRRFQDRFACLPDEASGGEWRDDRWTDSAAPESLCASYSVKASCP